MQNKLRVGMGYTANPHLRTKKRKGEKRKKEGKKKTENLAQISRNN